MTYEDRLPEDMSDEAYDAWYAHSRVVDGVRVGPPVGLRAALWDILHADIDNHIPNDLHHQAKAAIEEADKAVDELLRDLRALQGMAMGREAKVTASTMLEAVQETLAKLGVAL